MAIFYCEAKMVSRSQGQNVIAKAAYEARTTLKDEQENKIKNYKYKGGLFYEGITLPENAPEWLNDRQTLWNTVVRKENESKHWRTAQEARRLILALPHENNQEQNIETLKSISSFLAKQGMCVDCAGHLPEGKSKTVINGEKTEVDNVHAHILLTTRNVDQNGFGKKNRLWNDRKYYHDVIEKGIAEIINRTLSPEKQIQHTPYDREKRSYKGSVHQGLGIQRERRLEKLLNDEYESWKKQTSELEKLTAPSQKSENKSPAISQKEEKQPQHIEQKHEIKKPEQPRTKEELFVNICRNQAPDIRACLQAELDDIQNRNERIKKGGYDSKYESDKKIVDKTKDLYNDALPTRDYEK